jgi:hypothetical protein
LSLAEATTLVDGTAAGSDAGSGSTAVGWSGAASATRLKPSRPTPLISISTRWPARARGAPWATPSIITSPGAKVMKSLTSASSWAAGRIIPPVVV